MSTPKSKLLSKKVLIVTIFAVGAISVILAASLVVLAAAQQHQQYHQRMMLMREPDEGTSQINGSMSVAKDTSNFINKRAKVSFVAAAQTAQGEVTNGTVLGGHLSGCMIISYTSC